MKWERESLYRSLSANSSSIFAEKRWAAPDSYCRIAAITEFSRLLPLLPNVPPKKLFRTTKIFSHFVLFVFICNAVNKFRRRHKYVYIFKPEFCMVYTFTDNGLLHTQWKKTWRLTRVYCVVFQEDDLTWRTPKKYYAELHYIKHTLGKQRFHHHLE